ITDSQRPCTRQLRTSLRKAGCFTIAYLTIFFMTAAPKTDKRIAPKSSYIPRLKGSQLPILAHQKGSGKFRSGSRQVKGSCPYHSELRASPLLNPAHNFHG